MEQMILLRHVILRLGKDGNRPAYHLYDIVVVARERGFGGLIMM